ncbi:MAG TPA: uroporphyrinogen-III synthase, partial [Pirellulales bacterium]|nr:uroporphyrinogen-III synthase [Pirellulales bacterium]
MPVLEICPPESFGPLDAALRGLSDYDWLILTSSNTVRALVQRARKLGVSLASTGTLQVAAVGQGTAAAARDAGLQITYVPETYVAESLIKGLAGNMAEKRVLLAQAAVARNVIPEAFRAAGAQVDVVAAYRNRMPASAPERLRAALAEGIDAATFTSSSSVTHLADAARARGLAWPFAGVAAVSIGPITTATLRATSWEPAVEASQSDIPGL